MLWHLMTVPHPGNNQIPGTYTGQKHEPTPQRKEEWKHKRVLQHPLKLSTETPNHMVGVCLLNTGMLSHCVLLQE